MSGYCSVSTCSEMSVWRFANIRLCQRHWQEWCRSTWRALAAKKKQPIMEDWVAYVGVRETEVVFGPSRRPFYARW